jgi:hypothetical protein
MVKAETVDRAGKIDGQPAHTREVKLGCVFTQPLRTSRAGPCVMKTRPPMSAPFETAENFGLPSTPKSGSVAGAAQKKKVVIGDGAVWIWNLTDQHFPGAMQIVDLYHA